MTTLRFYDWRRCAPHRIAAEIRHNVLELGRGLHVLLIGDRVELVDRELLTVPQQQQRIATVTSADSIEHIIETLVLAIAEDLSA